MNRGDTNKTQGKSISVDAPHADARTSDVTFVVSVVGMWRQYVMY